MYHFLILFVCIAVSSCAQLGLSTDYTVRLQNSGDEKLIKHANYFRNKYGWPRNNIGEIAYTAIVQGEILLVQYKITSVAFKENASNEKTVIAFNSLRAVLTEHLGNYSTVWSSSISANTRNPRSYVDFSTALATVKEEYTRLGVFEKMDDFIGQAKQRIVKLDPNKYAKTYELYAVLNQLAALAKEPSGSLVTFNQMVNSLQNDFSKAYALAEIEALK